jgi:hypothetical protein
MTSTWGQEGCRARLDPLLAHWEALEVSQLPLVGRSGGNLPTHAG